MEFISRNEITALCIPNTENQTFYTNKKWKLFQVGTFASKFCIILCLVFTHCSELDNCVSHGTRLHAIFDLPTFWYYQSLLIRASRQTFQSNKLASTRLIYSITVVLSRHIFSAVFYSLVKNNCIFYMFIQLLLCLFPAGGKSFHHCRAYRTINFNSFFQMLLFITMTSDRHTVSFGKILLLRNWEK